MTIVRIVKNYKVCGAQNRCKTVQYDDSLDILRQTPGGKGVWGDIHFTLDEVNECDYLLILNTPEKNVKVRCPKQNVWCIIQEPPDTLNQYLYSQSNPYSRIYAPKLDPASNKFIASAPATPWLVDKSYDFLKSCVIPQKTRNLSWVLSKSEATLGKRKRVQFLKLLSEQLEFDLYGIGYNQISDKWNALAPYHYTIAYENYSNSHYWTEKLADAYLSWTMPIYFGCTDIHEYFPKDSMVQISPEDADATRLIKQTIQDNSLWKKNLDAITHARNLVLEQYQLFPFIAKEIAQDQTQEKTHTRVKISKAHREKQLSRLFNKLLLLQKQKIANKDSSGIKQALNGQNLC